MHAAPCWFTVNVCPAIVTVPVRAAVAVFALMLMLTLPFPVPPAPPVTRIHGALLVAVHEHPVGAVTATFVDPAGAGTDAVVAESVNVHAAPAWLTVTV